MKPEKRGKLQIYFDILQLMCDKAGTSRGLCRTQIAHKANLPYDRFREYLDQIIRLGMVAREGDRLVVTEKGLDYIQWHGRMIDFLKHMELWP